jgi:hypothetical protein
MALFGALINAERRPEALVSPFLTALSEAGDALVRHIDL